MPINTPMSAARFASLHDAAQAAQTSGIGAYRYLRAVGLANASLNQLVAASSIQDANATSQGTLSGTWKYLGGANGATQDYLALFVRTA